MTLVKVGEYVSQWRQNHDDIALIIGTVVAVQRKTLRVRGHIMTPSGLKKLQIGVSGMVGNTVHISLEDLLEECEHSSYEGLLNIDESLSLIPSETYDFVNLWLTSKVPDIMAGAEANPDAAIVELESIQTPNTKFNQSIRFIIDGIREDKLKGGA